MADEDLPIALSERQTAGKPLVLIIDDNPQYAHLFELLSDRLGITAYIVDSCGAGMLSLEKFSFEVILMDWVMPEIDGPMCTKHIRELEKKTGSHIPIIGVSGHVKANHERCIAAGMDDYLPVPFTLELLQEKLCYWLKRKTGV
jgi:CheY-like chemotaxis protein